MGVSFISVDPAGNRIPPFGVPVATRQFPSSPSTTGGLLLNRSSPIRGAPPAHLPSFSMDQAQSQVSCMAQQAFRKRWMTSTTSKRDIRMSEHDGFFQVCKRVATVYYNEREVYIHEEGTVYEQSRGLHESDARWGHAGAGTAGRGPRCRRSRDMTTIRQFLGHLCL